MKKEIKSYEDYSDEELLFFLQFREKTLLSEIIRRLWNEYVDKKRIKKDG